MSNFNVEYKVVTKDETGSETRYFKKVVDAGAVATLVTTLATQEGIEFFTLRKVVEKPVKPQKPEVKK